MPKTIIRKEIRKIRDSLSPDERKKKDKDIIKRLFHMNEFMEAMTIMFFASYKSEPNIFEIIRESLNIGKRVVLPKVNIIKKELLLYEIKHCYEMDYGYMDIPEPDVVEDRRMNPEVLDLIIMPGIAFDEKGGRIGYGGGYYDRLISNIEEKTPLIAIAYDEQIVKKVPIFEHDVRVDKIITDKRIIEC